MKYLSLLLLPATLLAVPLNLSWVYNSSNELGFEVERRQVDIGSWEVIGTVAQDVVTFSDELPAGDWKYRVRAFNENGYSDYSNILEIGTSLPNAPSGLNHDLTPVLSIITNPNVSITVSPVNL